MEPSNKTPEIDAAIARFLGMDRCAAIRANVCVPKPYGCGQPIAPFRDELSRREYTISGLCQACQDSVFGAD